MEKPRKAKAATKRTDGAPAGAATRAATLPYTGKEFLDSLDVNYSGSHEEIRRYALFGALASGQYGRWKAFAETCMAEYDIDGWTAKDLVNPGGAVPLR